MKKIHPGIRGMIIIIGPLLILAAVLYFRQQRQQKEMDAQEVHYDADNYFLMIEATNGIAGFYFCERPLTHMRIRTDAPDGVYDAYFHNGDMFLEHTEHDATIQVRLTKQQAEWIEAEYEDGFPALVYRRR